MEQPSPPGQEEGRQLEALQQLQTSKLGHQGYSVPNLATKTVFITPFSLFEFPPMPYGLKNAGMTFQHFMDQLFKGRSGPQCAKVHILPLNC